MSNRKTHQQERREVITLLGTSAVALPVLGLAGCDKGGNEAASSTPAEAAADAIDATESAAADTAAAARDAVDTMAREAESAQAAAEQVVTDAVDAAEEMAEDVAAQAGDAMQEMQEQARVDEGGAQARSLSYKHDATEVDAGAQPRYAAGQQCSNCALFQGGSEPWGACPIFAGKMVKSTGWCSAYVAAG
jgi:flagellar biosynthesis GTPase FlhF